MNRKQALSLVHRLRRALVHLEATDDTSFLLGMAERLALDLQSVLTEPESDSEAVLEWLDHLLPLEKVTIYPDGAVYTRGAKPRLPDTLRAVTGPARTALPTLARQFSDLEAAEARETIPAPPEAS